MFGAVLSADVGTEVNTRIKQAGFFFLVLQVVKHEKDWLQFMLKGKDSKYV